MRDVFTIGDGCAYRRTKAILMKRLQRRCRPRRLIIADRRILPPPGANLKWDSLVAWDIVKSGTVGGEEVVHPDRPDPRV